MRQFARRASGILTLQVPLQPGTSFSDSSLVLAREAITMNTRLAAGLVECFVLI
jgi:hypothetical protein